LDQIVGSPPIGRPTRFLLAAGNFPFEIGPRDFSFEIRRGRRCRRIQAVPEKNCAD
jgi:hypothetical protein